jgi:hypothetical protein
MLANLKCGGAVPRHRVGLALRAGMRGQKARWTAQAKKEIAGIRSINHLFGGSRWGLVPVRRRYLPSAGRCGSPISVQIGVSRPKPPNDSLPGALFPSHRFRRQATPLPRR